MFNWIGKYIVRYVARKKGFIDPIAMFARISAIGQPARTHAPLELLRAGAVLHARGFMNNNVIQHNLDWVWPFWVERQFDPTHPSFIPRAFSMTHINITQRNWTAVGFPGCAETPVVDARGLVMPFFDSWSLEGWFVPDNGDALLPSRTGETTQRLELSPNLRVITQTLLEGSRLESTSEILAGDEGPILRVTLRCEAARAGWLAACVRPYNAEGVSFINELSLLTAEGGWEINRKHTVLFSRVPDARLLSTYKKGDVLLALRQGEMTSPDRVSCEVGMATGAAMYRVEARDAIEIYLDVPLTKNPSPANSQEPAEAWNAALLGSAAFEGGERFKFLYDAALRTTVLLSPREIYAGPYTYKRFWYRDAAIILHALMCAGHRQLAEKSLDFFVAGQSMTGYFKSQEGEWDSNGQVLWALGRFCRLFHEKPKPLWIVAIRKGVHWIARKRGETKPVKGQAPTLHDGLLPAGFSAEHFGPNDHYYWDDFWTIGGLRLAEEMLRSAGDTETADLAAREEAALSEAVDRSLLLTAQTLRTPAMPVSPYRRLDSANVGSLAVGFPLQLWPASDERLAGTVEYLVENCLIHNAFYHDISHSGINAYLTLHIAQCLLRAGDPRFLRLMQGIADLASETGQWPEAIHPQLRTGSMGDGQHAWAAAEWMMMVRNCFLFEEEFENRLVLGAGLSVEYAAGWCAPGKPARFGPAPTRFGPVTVTLEFRGDDVEFSWSAEWFGLQPEIEIRLDLVGWEEVHSEPQRRRYRRSSDHEVTGDGKLPGSA